MYKVPPIKYNIIPKNKIFIQSQSEALDFFSELSFPGSAATKSLGQAAQVFHIKFVMHLASDKNIGNPYKKYTIYKSTKLFLPFPLDPCVVPFPCHTPA